MAQSARRRYETTNRNDDGSGNITRMYNNNNIIRTPNIIMMYVVREPSRNASSVHKSFGGSAIVFHPRGGPFENITRPEDLRRSTSALFNNNS